MRDEASQSGRQRAAVASAGELAGARRAKAVSGGVAPHRKLTVELGTTEPSLNGRPPCARHGRRPNSDDESALVSQHGDLGRDARPRGNRRNGY